MAQWNAHEYHQHSSMQQQLALEVLNRMHLRGDEHVLDIGCGDGKVTAELARRVPRGVVVGIDLSEEMICFAARAHPTSAGANLSFRICDATCLPFQDEFDLAVSFATLHWVADHLSVLRGVRRSLKPGGRLVAQCGGRGNLDALLPAAEAVLRAAPWREYFAGFTMPWSFYGVEEYQQWLPEIGLKSERIELIPKQVRHAGSEGLAAWLRTTWLPYLDRVPETLRSNLAAEIAAEYARRHPTDREGCLRVPMVRLEVEAVKASSGKR
jgi:trans-aconitate methyltransferase